MTALRAMPETGTCPIAASCDISYEGGATQRRSDRAIVPPRSLVGEGAMSYDHDTDDDFDPDRFPLSADDLHKIGSVITLIREQLISMAPQDLKSAAVVLRALERLPATTSGAEVTFGFVSPNGNGNFGWADISISESELTLGTGQHFHDPSVGGDTESRHEYEAYAGSDFAEGDIEQWLVAARHLSAKGNICVDDYSDYEAIDWSSETDKG